MHRIPIFERLVPRAGYDQDILPPLLFMLFMLTVLLVMRFSVGWVQKRMKSVLSLVTVSAEKCIFYVMGISAFTGWVLVWFFGVAEDKTFSFFQELLMSLLKGIAGYGVLVLVGIFAIAVPVRQGWEFVMMAGVFVFLVWGTVYYFLPQGVILMTLPLIYGMGIVYGDVLRKYEEKGKK